MAKKKADFKAPTHTIEFVRLEELESAVYRREHERAGMEILEAYRRLRAGGVFAYSRGDEEGLAALFARLAAAITALITDPKFEFSSEGYARFQVDTAMTSAVFEASPMENADHIARVLSQDPSERDPQKFSFNVISLAKWLLFYGLNSGHELDFEKVFTEAAPMTMPYWAGLLASTVVVTPAAHHRREALLRMGRFFENLEVPDIALAPLSDAFMYCSYTVGEDKHDVKRVISGMISRTIAARTRLPRPEELAARRARWLAKRYRPTMVVPVEWFGSYHAMYRCYAPVIAQLKQHFKLVVCAHEAAMDEKARSMFDGFIPLPPDGLMFENVIKKFNEAQPDIIYYPSVGMAAWWVALASVRLAPIQIMTLGHPATSNSPSMDYVLSEESTFTDPALFSERLVATPDGSGYFAPRPDQSVITTRPIRPVLDDATVVDLPPVKVAIPSMSLKINYPYVQTLGRIVRAAKRKVELHFFPNAMGVTLFQFRKHMRRGFPNCVVRERTGYELYAKWLAEADLVLVPFPFGGTNSTVDSLLLGIPVVARIGAQPHDRFDALILKRCGLDAWVVQDEAEYEALAVKMIDDERARYEAQELVRSKDLDKLLYADSSGHQSGAAGRAFRHVFEHHEDISRRPKSEIVHWSEFT